MEHKRIKDCRFGSMLISEAIYLSFAEVDDSSRSFEKK